MAIEIERKFLLKNEAWKTENYTYKHYKQAYFCNTSKVSVRVRLADDEAWVSFKSATVDISRFEYEYPVPVEEAEHMMNEFGQGSIISKTRYFVPIGQHVWEIDVFSDDNEGLVVAEVELNEVEEKFVIPEWIGDEVSNDSRYFNSNLVTYPFKNW